MSKVFFKETSSSSGYHRDYGLNLANARNFCNKVQKDLLQGMAVKVANSEGLNQALLMISFQPPRGVKMGTYATPIPLHQDSTKMVADMNHVYDSYISYAKYFWDNQPKMRQIDLLQCPKDEF